jgi:hypothetical protein
MILLTHENAASGLLILCRYRYFHLRKRGGEAIMKRIWTPNPSVQRLTDRR